MFYERICGINKMLLSVEEMVVEKQIVVDLSELGERTQPCRQLLYVLQSHPVLIQLFVHAVHISYYALRLCKEIVTLFFSCTFSCFRRLASSKILDSICLSQPFSNIFLSISCSFLLSLSTSSASLILWRSLILAISALNYDLRTII